MAENKNFFKIDGVLFDKPKQNGTSKDGKPYSITKLMLEVDDSYNRKDGGRVDQKFVLEFNITPKVESVLGLYSPRDFVTVSFKVTGRKYKDKYFSGFLCWDIKHADLDSNRPAGTPVQEMKGVQTQQATVIQNDDDDGLPF